LAATREEIPLLTGFGFGFRLLAADSEGFLLKLRFRRNANEMQGISLRVATILKRALQRTPYWR
jgi:hypothetical protein